MSVNLIFKIAAGRDSCIHTLSGVKAQRKRRTGILDQSGRTFTGFILDRAIYL